MVNIHLPQTVNIKRMTPWNLNLQAIPLKKNPPE
jgi:hypothetical protein